MTDDRRLAEHTAMGVAVLCEEIERLRASNAELLAALQDNVNLAEMAMRLANRDCGEFDIDGELEAACAAIAKATGDTQ